MLSESMWLYDRWYGLDARERMRHLALWGRAPVLLYANCGLPPDAPRVIEEELELFQKEGILQFWEYEDERRFPESLASFITHRPRIVSSTEYTKIMAFVDARLIQSAPNLCELGFRTMEGMLLEQVVLRRRYLAQALCGSLNARTLACEGSAEGQAPFHGEIMDTLKEFFSTIALPSLILLEIDAFLELRRRSQLVLPSIVEELHKHFESEPSAHRRKSAVNRLVNQYRSELNMLVRALRSRTVRTVYEALEHGTVTQMQSKMELFLLDETSAHNADWFARDAEGNCRLALLLLQWRSGQFGRHWRVPKK